MLQFVEGTFNQVPLFVQFPVILPESRSVGSWWYDRNGFLLLNEFQYLVAVIPFVSNHVSSLDASQQWYSLGGIVGLTAVRIKRMGWPLASTVI